ncbi:hypothetical protein BAUCODRAFT_27476 [Baudoinia panamericana UAMH 10762]|uniref:Uncharacterized protein n=1 Tax=Baudoinia panamericana (strain UAMH 10762) TaxID=717646 RepID=M2M749_BAUPA|nr:uncharacterized protein BAUCODRAFT_27476 [Baudoinia panamericana UAMH 10762]EMC92126.1 hypothetical protein BAUCODRAFT_27476 [Baudoinia panamericana UAMH 10762]
MILAHGLTYSTTLTARGSFLGPKRKFNALKALTAIELDFQLLCLRKALWTAYYIETQYSYVRDVLAFCIPTLAYITFRISSPSGAQATFNSANKRATCCGAAVARYSLLALALSAFTTHAFTTFVLDLSVVSKPMYPPLVCSRRRLVSRAERRKPWMMSILFIDSEGTLGLTITLPFSALAAACADKCRSLV